jgi:hypothetical protein
VTSFVKSEIASPESDTTVEDASGCSVTIPAGAVSEETEITIQTPFPGTEPSPSSLPRNSSIQTARDFGPDGIVFNEPVLIKIYYDEALLGKVRERTLKIYYYNEEKQRWTFYPGSKVNIVENYVYAWVDHFTVFAAVGFDQLSATIDIDPDAINLKSKGKYVTGYITLPPGFNPADIEISSITLNGTIPACESPYSVGDYDNDGTSDLMVKFSRQVVHDNSSPGAAVPFTVAGELTDGIPFTGTDNICIMDKGALHLNEADPSSVVE